MESVESLSHNWKVFSTVTLLFCILNLAFAFVPEIGAWAMFSGVAALILSIIVLIKSIRSNTSKLIAMISLIIAFASIGTGYWTLSRIDFFDLTKDKPDTLIIKH